MSVRIVKAAAIALCGALTFSGGSALAQEAQSLDQQRSLKTIIVP